MKNKVSQMQQLTNGKEADMNDLEKKETGSEKISALSCTDFVGVLSSKSPVPGGGGASALIGAIGVALGNMVGSLTVGKKKYAEVEPQIKELMEKSEVLMGRLLELIDEDAKAFEPLAKAYSMPKDTAEQLEEKEKVMAEALYTAAMAPLNIMKACCEAIDIVGEFAEKGSRLAVSDAGVAAAALEAALKGASLNVYINTKLMKDRETAESINDCTDGMLEEYMKKSENIFTYVKDELR